MNQEDGNPPVERLINPEKQCPYIGQACIKGECRKWLQVQEMVMHSQLSVPHMQSVWTCMDDQIMLSLANTMNMIGQGMMQQRRPPGMPPGMPSS